MVNDLAYSPNDIESDTFLSEIPLSLMEENIKMQFKDPLEYRKKDYLTIFINMYRYSLDYADAYEDEDADGIMELRDRFYGFMINLFREYFGIGFVNFESLSQEDQDDLIHYTYRFFIINMKKNFVCLIMNYIDKTRDQYESLTLDDDKKKNVTAMSLKKEVTDPTDIYILSNLYSIMRDIFSMEIYPEDFFENCDIDEVSLETRFVSSKFDSDIITGNFTNRYINMLSPDFKSDIESKVRNKILKKYKKKKDIE